jgi:hypothetical protein
MKFYLLGDFLYVVDIRLTGRDQRCRSGFYEDGYIETALSLAAAGTSC